MYSALSRRFVRARTGLELQVLAYISPYLAYISPYLPSPRRCCSRRYLPYISPISRLHLPYISEVLLSVGAITAVSLLDPPLDQVRVRG